MGIIKAVPAVTEAQQDGKAAVFPKGTIVHYGGVPCELLEDCTFYSATDPSQKQGKSDGQRD